MEVHNAMPGPQGFDEVFSSIVSGLRPESMVPERTESVSKSGARIMLEECLQNKLEVLTSNTTKQAINVTAANNTKHVASSACTEPTHHLHAEIGRPACPETDPPRSHARTRQNSCLWHASFHSHTPQALSRRRLQASLPEAPPRQNPKTPNSVQFTSELYSSQT